MSNENLNVPPPQGIPPTPSTVAGTPPTPETVTPAVATPDLLRQQGLAQAPQTPSVPAGRGAAPTLASAFASDVQGAAPPAIEPALVRVAPNGIAGGTANPRAVAIDAPVTPPIATGLTRVAPNGIAAGTESPRATPIGLPATPTIVSSTAPVAVGQPTLATAGPVQGSAAPRIAGVQMVPPTPPAVQTASTLTQTQNAPQTLAGISTLLQQS